ncbi:hypothetical protein K435DRAFT_494868 [Dendrothele bispora CBS 962.96]|uniref:Uncharacterized protein n=1 Tax=Dendrothele bispora (strain CBS 962.96) TaxID=1314807 RepID=A0A4S8KX96_DENBC|nr:hypothetical protein K435DRAFT_494868 [Dendrothele bispora CBS 962.96]
MSSRTPAPVNLKERIAALEQRNVVQNQKQTPSPSTTPSPSSSTLNVPPTNALRDRIAKFEKKGGVPVPRGSFGLGAPPPSENAPAKRRGELYGNRIPTPLLRSHHTGNGMMSNGAPTTSRPTSPLGFPVQNKRMSMSGLDFEKYQGMEFSLPSGESGESTPADFRESSGSFSPPPTADIDAYLQARQDAKLNRQKESFAAAMGAAKKAEAEGKGPFQQPRSREGSMSPETVLNLDEANAPAILVSKDKEELELLTREFAANKTDTPPTQTNDLSASPEPEPEPVIRESVDDEVVDSAVEPQSQSVERVGEQFEENHDDNVALPTNPSNTDLDVVADDSKLEEDETTPKASTIPVISSPPQTELIVQDTDAIASADLVPDSVTTADKSLPVTPLPETPKSFSTPSRLRDSFMSSRPTSIIDASPGHIAFAQRVAPTTGKAYNVYIPAKTSALTSSKPVTSEAEQREPAINASKSTPSTIEEDGEGQIAQTDEFGVVTIGPVPSKHKNQISRSFSATVHGKVREASSSSPPLTTSSVSVVKSNTLPMTPHRSRKQNNKAEAPMSPGFTDLASLLETTALLEQRLMEGEIPSEFGKMADAEAARAVAEEMKVLEKEQRTEELRKQQDLLREKLPAKEEGAKSAKSMDTLRSKMSFKNTLGKKRSTRAESESEDGPRTLDASKSRKASTATLTAKASASTPALLDTAGVPEVAITPPKPRREQSVPRMPASTDEELGALSVDGDKSDLASIPPTPPPKSPRYLTGLRRLASSGKTHAMRLSMSLASEPSSEDSAPVVTPPDVSEFGFPGNRRSGFIGPSGGGVPWPNQSPRKRSGASSVKSGGSIKGGSGFKGSIGKMLGRGRTKSGNSLASTFDGHETPYKPELPAVDSPSPSLHEILLPSTMELTPIPVIEEPSELPYAAPSTPPPRSSFSIKQSPQSIDTRRASWISSQSSNTSSAAQSPLFDKEFFDSFPSVPQTTPSMLGQGRIPMDLDLRANDLFGNTTSATNGGREQANSPPIHV